MDVVQGNLFNNDDIETEVNIFKVGSNLKIKLKNIDIYNSKRIKGEAYLYRNDVEITSTDLSDHFAKRVFVVEAVKQGAIKVRLSECLGISRQSVDNYLDTVKHFGLSGLLNNHSPTRGKNISKTKQLDKETRLQGRTAEQLSEIRKQEQDKIQKSQLSLNFSFEDENKECLISSTEQPFSVEHDWEFTRYAGVIVYLVTLLSTCNWLKLTIGHFGKGYKIFLVFMLMAAKNIRSIEALKNIRLGEAGILLGIGKLPSRPVIWQWFYNVAKQRLSKVLLYDYFRYQINVGLVSVWFWFIDGHLLPYTGKNKVHYAYNTQRRMPVPGRTNMVMTDGSGRIVDFEIQEGKGDIRDYILQTKKKWEDVVTVEPIRVFDREGRGVKFYCDLVQKEIPFVCWETNVDKEKLNKINDEKFNEEFEMNGKKYRFFEEEKKFTIDDELIDTVNNLCTSTDKKHTFVLRHIYLWNMASNRRVCGLAWTGEKKVSTQDCAYGILSRWGASENTFKHLNDRHPGHYHPGFKLTESDKQTIKNPEIISLEKEIKKIKKDLNNLYKEQVKAKDVYNKDGSFRKNSVKENIKVQIREKDEKLKKSLDKKKSLPDRINLTDLSDYKSFKRIDNEGKNLFDFVTSSVWNARKQMVELLQPIFNCKNEVVDLFYAIADCHGKVKSTKKEIIVKLEPLQQPKRRAAQEQFCNKLTKLFVKTPNGKLIIVKVED